MQLRNRRRHQAVRGDAGFSLVELLVATSLGLVAVSSFLTFNRYQLFSLQDQSKQIDLQTTARNIVDLFAREVRRAGMNPTCAGTFKGIAVAKASEIQIKTDLNGDGSTNGQNENVTYRFNYSLKSVERVTPTSTETLISNVDFTGSSIKYYDGNGTELIPWYPLGETQRNNVRRVRIELRLSQDAVDPNKDTELRASASTDVNLRNRFFVSTLGCAAS